MRVRPTAAAATVVFVAYAALIVGVWFALDVDYDRITDSAESLRRGVVIPMAAGMVLLVVATTVLGWWRPSLFEDRRAGHRGLGIAAAALFGVGALLNVGAARWSDLPAEFVLWCAIGTAMVGFNEELLTRGLAIVGARGSMSERWVWIFSSALFAVLHAVNVLFGPSIGSTAVQMLFAFLLGAVFYVIRRTVGTILVTMVLHMLWDFGTFLDQHTGAAGPGGVGLAGAVVVGLIALVLILRSEPATPSRPLA